MPLNIDYTPLTTALQEKSINLCRDFLHQHPSIPIPIEILKDVLRTRRIQILQLFIPKRVSYEQIKPHSFDLLKTAYELEDFKIWVYLVENVCDITKRFGEQSALYLLLEYSSDSIQQSILERSPPLLPCTNKADLAFIESAINDNNTASPLFTCLPPDLLVFDNPSTFHHLIDLAVSHENWGAVAWLVIDHCIPIENEHTPFSQHLNNIIAKNPPLTDDVLSIIEMLLHIGAYSTDTIEYYDFLRQLLIEYGRRYNATSLYNDEVKSIRSIIEILLEQGNISVNGKDEWKQNRDQFITLIEVVIMSDGYVCYAFLNQLLAKGARIPPSVYHYFDTKFQPTILLDRAIECGYQITTKTILSFHQNRNDYPIYHRNPWASSNNNDICTDDGIISIISRDEYSQNDAFWVNLRKDIITSDQNKHILKTLIEYLLGINRYDIVELFIAHGFKFPDDCDDGNGQWNILHQQIHPDSLTKILSWGLPLNQLNERGRTPLDCAVMRMRPSKFLAPKIALSLFLNGASFGPSMKNVDPSVLYKVISINNAAMVQCLLDIAYHQDSTSKNHDYYPFQHVKGYEVAKVLIDSGFPVDSADPRHCTPLCYVKDISVAQLLIDHGAKVDGNGIGDRPVCNAIMNNNWPLVDLLVENKANTNLKGHNILRMVITHFNDASYVQYLLNHGLDVSLYTASDLEKTFLAIINRTQINYDLVRLMVANNIITLTSGKYFGTLVTHGLFDLIEELMDYDSIVKCFSLEYEGNSKDFYHHRKLRMDQDAFDFFQKYNVDFNDQRIMHKVKLYSIEMLNLTEHYLQKRIQFHPILSCNDRYSDIDCGILTHSNPNWSFMWALINRGANVNADNGRDFTLSFFIRESPRDKVNEYVSELIKHGAHVNPIYPIADDLPLVAAIKERDWDIVKLLIHHGADVMATFTKDNRDNRSILHLLIHYIIRQIRNPQIKEYREVIESIKASPTYSQSLLSRTDANGKRAVDYIDSKSPYSCLCPLLE